MLPDPHVIPLYSPSSLSSYLTWSKFKKIQNLMEILSIEPCILCKAYEWWRWWRWWCWSQSWLGKGQNASCFHQTTRILKFCKTLQHQGPWLNYLDSRSGDDNETVKEMKSPFEKVSSVSWIQQLGRAWVGKAEPDLSLSAHSDPIPNLKSKPTRIGELLPMTFFKSTLITFTGKVILRSNCILQ